MFNWYLRVPTLQTFRKKYYFWGDLAQRVGDNGWQTKIEAHLHCQIKIKAKKLRTKVFTKPYESCS